MAELTYSKATIRRAIGRASRQEFFLRYGDTNVIIASSDNTTVLVNFADVPAITQDSDFWLGQWLYDELLQEERIILNSSSGGGIDVETGFSVGASSGDSFEIWGLWPPSIVHDAMNRSIRHAWDFFPDIVISEALVLVEDTLTYGMAASDMTTADAVRPAVGEVLNIWLEVNRNTIDGQVTSTVAAGSVVAFSDTETGFPDTDNLVDSDWLISIYSGPCRGQLRQLNTVDTDGLLTVDTDWDSGGVGLDQPTSDSRFKIWDPSSQSEDDWYKLSALRFDQPTDPDFMYLHEFYPAALGMRMRVQYLAQTTDLSDEADVTRVPMEFVIYKSLSILYAEMVPDNRHDRASMAGLAEYYGQLAEKFANDEARPLPPRTVWREKDFSGYGMTSNRLNPLDWEGR